MLQSVLVEFEDRGKIHANSGCMIDNYIIITSNIFVSTMIRESDIMEKMKVLQCGFSHPKVFFEAPPETNIVINQANPYISKPAKVIAIYRSSSIKKQLPTYFKDWLMDEDDESKQLKEIFSIFFILGKNTEGYHLDIDDFVQSLRKVINVFPDYPMKLGDKIVIEGTPFGSRHFLRSRSKGIVSNIFGADDCFVLTDTPTSPGCEGSPIYLKSKKLPSSPVGIVVASLSWWRGEWIGLTLGVTFPALFSDTIPTFQHFKIAFNEALEHQINKVLYHGLVQIISGTSWGSGVLLDKESGIIITNSHVIESPSPTILWYDVEISSKIIYKSAENEIYDIAVLAADIIALKKTKMAAVKISRDEILKGETVFAAGFPLFSHATKPKPTLTKGCISHISQGMIKTTCSVLPGSSGGAILRKNGELIGIITCNTRLDDNISAVPRVNMAIPIANIIEPILTYIKTKDPAVLEKLKVDDLPIRKEWNFVSSRL